MKNGLLVVLMLALFMAGNACALDDCPLEEQWNTTFYEEDDNYISSVICLPSGGYAVTGVMGVTGTSCDSNSFFYKLDSDGKIELRNSFGGNQEDWFETLIDNGDQGYVAIGNSVSYGSGRLAPWIVKLDQNGNEVWNKTPYDSSFWVGSGYKTSDGNLAIVGIECPFISSAAIGHKALLMKADSEGNELWTKSYGKDTKIAMDKFSSFQETTDGGYIMAGVTTSYSRSNKLDGWLVKTDSEGNELWNESFGDRDDDLLGFVLPSDDGGYIAVGETKPYGSPLSNAWIVKTDENGSPLWEKRYFDEDASSFNCIIKSSDGNYIAVGSIGSVPEGSVKSMFGVDHYDGLIMKLDEEGNQVWNKTFNSYDSSSFNTVMFSNGTYTVAGYAIPEGSDDKDALVVMYKDPSIVVEATENVSSYGTVDVTSYDSENTTSSDSEKQSPLPFSVTLAGLGMAFIAIRKHF